MSTAQVQVTESHRVALLLFSYKAEVTSRKETSATTYRTSTAAFPDAPCNFRKQANAEGSALWASDAGMVWVYSCHMWSIKQGVLVAAAVLGASQ